MFTVGWGFGLGFGACGGCAGGCRGIGATMGTGLTIVGSGAGSSLSVSSSDVSSFGISNGSSGTKVASFGVWVLDGALEIRGVSRLADGTLDGT